MKITVDSVYRLCNRQNYFTCGDLAQYEKMFQFVESVGNDISQQELYALSSMIWICSKNQMIADILKELKKIATP